MSFGKKLKAKQIQVERKRLKPLEGETSSAYLIRIFGAEKYNATRECDRTSLEKKSVSVLARRARFLVRALNQDMAGTPVRLLKIPIIKTRAKIETITEFWGSDKWKVSPSLMGHNLEKLKTRVGAITEFWGNDKWKIYPPLAARNFEKLKTKIEAITQFWGNDKWKIYPPLAARNLEKLRTKAEAITEFWGSDKWKSRPSLAAHNLEKLETKIEAITEFWGNDKWKSCPSLAARNLKKLETKIEAITEFWGNDKWKSCPSLAIRNLERLKFKKEILLKALENNWNCSPVLMTMDMQGRLPSLILTPLFEVPDNRIRYWIEKPYAVLRQCLIHISNGSLADLLPEVPEKPKQKSALAQWEQQVGAIMQMFIRKVRNNKELQDRVALTVEAINNKYSKIGSSKNNFEKSFG